MTNIVSGQKRSREEVEIATNKRVRDRDGRDWRDVHLKTPRKPSGREEIRDEGNGRRGGETSGRGTRGLNHESGHQGSYEKHDRNRGADPRSRSPQTRGYHQSSAPRIEDEKEEGE